MEFINVVILWIIAGIAIYQGAMQIAKKRTNTEVEKEQIEESPKKWQVAVGILLVILTIGVSRCMAFGSLPHWIGVDEAGIAYDAYSLALQGTDRYLHPFPVYMVNFGGGQSALYTYLAALCIKLFGFSITAVRLPALLFYIASIGLMYYMVAKWKNKKLAILTAFLILICPWHIVQSRYALDCNLLAPMVLGIMIGILQSKKWWHYALTGVLIGVALYTYSLSWLILPVCLAVWIIYLLYTKKLSGKAILAMGIPAFLLAIPLFCFLAVNKGILPEMQWGRITIPKLYEFRSGEIGLQSPADIVENLKKLFLKGPLDASNCFYYAEWLLSFIGIGVVTWHFGKQIKKRNFQFSHFMWITVVAIFVCLLLVEDMNTTKSNAFYMPMLYFAALGIQMIGGQKKKLLAFIILLHILAFGVFEWYYYTSYEEQSKNPYNDAYLYEITKQVEEKFPEKETYIITYAVSQSYIYTAIANEIPPTVFDETKKVTLIPLENEKDHYVRVDQIGNYHFIEGKRRLEQVEIDENGVYVVQKYYPAFINALQEKIGLKEIYGQEYYVFYK